MTEITHADQLTRTEFNKLIRQKKTWAWIGAFTVIIGVFIGMAAGPVGGIVAALVTIAVGVGITYGQAGSKAEEAFYDSYAKSRGLQKSRKNLGQATELLRKGDKRRTDVMFSGTLDGDIKGSLALYTYTEVTRDSKGNKQESDFPFTLVTTRIPELDGHLTELVVHEQSGFRSLEKLEDAFRGNLERVKLESEALDERFEIFADESQDQVWLRTLFSPSFIVFLTEHPTRDLAFEFGHGKLCVFVPGHKDSNEEFDAMIQVGCQLARKLREEAVE